MLHAVCALMPGSDNFLDTDILQPMAAHYKSNSDDFNLKLRQMKRMIARKTTDNTMPDFDNKGDKLLAFAKFVSKYDEAFSNPNPNPVNKRVGMQHVLSDKAVRRPFDPAVVVDTDCMITTYQNVYYFTESFVDAKNKVRCVRRRCGWKCLHDAALH